MSILSDHDIPHSTKRTTPLCLFVQLASNIACSIWFSVNPGWAALTCMKYGMSLAPANSCRPANSCLISCTYMDIIYAYCAYYCLIGLEVFEAPAEHDFLSSSRMHCNDLAWLSFHVDAAQSCGSCGASAKDSEGGGSHQRPWQRFWACVTGKDFGERHEIAKSMPRSRSPKWAREFSLIPLDSGLFRFTRSRPSSAFLGGQETQSLSQSQPSWEPGGAVVQFVETLMDGPMGPSHCPASPLSRVPFDLSSRQTQNSATLHMVGTLLWSQMPRCPSFQ